MKSLKKISFIGVLLITLTTLSSCLFNMFDFDVDYLQGCYIWKDDATNEPDVVLLGTFDYGTDDGGIVPYSLDTKGLSITYNWDIICTKEDGTTAKYDYTVISDEDGEETISLKAKDEGTYTITLTCTATLKKKTKTVKCTEDYVYYENEYTGKFVFGRK